MSQPSSLSTAQNQQSIRGNGSSSPRTSVSPIDIPGTVTPRDNPSALEPAEEITSLPPLPRSPSSPQIPQEPPKGLFTSYRTGKFRARTREPTLRHVSQSLSTNNLGTGFARNTHPYGSSQASSTASLSHGNLLETAVEDGNEDAFQADAPLKPSSLPRADTEPRSKHLFGGFMTRSRSIREEDGSRTKSRLRPPRALEPRPATRPSDERQSPIKTAPLEPERSFRDMLGSSIRNKSADRHQADGDDRVLRPSTSFNSNAGGNFFSNIVNTSSKAADGLGKAGKASKGFFGKLARSGSSHEREVPDDAYVCRVINLPLVEQTRRTRVKARLEDAGDKTEFWMPALPYRCIDYLNLHGIEEEGLYRIPGSGVQVKHWQRRFDTEGDINLLNEPELYDINIIGSMFKAWLRELPDDILPRATQSMIARECIGAKETPQLMKDELSKLPPFNYYLLFAITCHISLLHEHADKNKMNYHNLCICFQPCMKIDGFCFQFLVQDWRNCWQGCWTEKHYREEEERVLREASGQPPTSAGRSIPASSTSNEDQASTHESARPVAMPQHGSAERVPAQYPGSAPADQRDESETPSSAQRPTTPPPKLNVVPTVSPMRM